MQFLKTSRFFNSSFCVQVALFLGTEIGNPNSNFTCNKMLPISIGWYQEQLFFTFDALVSATQIF